MTDMKTGQLIEKTSEFNILLFLCFVRYPKAFDETGWKHFWTKIEEMQTTKHLVQKNTAGNRIDQAYSESLKIRTDGRKISKFRYVDDTLIHKSLNQAVEK